MKLSANIVGDLNDENNFPHKLLLPNTQVSRLRKNFVNNSSANIKLSKTQFYKIGQSGGFLSMLLGPLLKTGLPLIKNTLKALPKSVLISLGLTEAASATDAAIYKEMRESGITTLIIFNEEMNDIVKIMKFLEESGLLIKDVNKTIKNEAREQKREFLSMFLGTLRASLLGTIWTGTGTITADQDF